MVGSAYSSGPPAYFFAAAFPVPDSPSDCSSCSALSMIVSVALYACAQPGANVTPIVRFAAGASGVSQTLVALNGLPAAPSPSIASIEEHRWQWIVANDAVNQFRAVAQGPNRPSLEAGLQIKEFVVIKVNEVRNRLVLWPVRDCLHVHVPSILFGGRSSRRPLITARSAIAQRIATAPNRTFPHDAFISSPPR
jgi:hypothetical protein